MTPSSAPISIVMATRTGATDFGGVGPILESIERTLHDPANIEIIIRGDRDDAGLDAVIAAVQAKNYPFPVHFFKGNRGRGYEDTHHFQNEAWLLTSACKKLIFALPEDVSLPIPHWDKLLLDEYEAAAKTFGHRVFTLHQTLEPGLCYNYEDTLESPDSFPIYTAQWINAVGGFSLMTCNDAWVQAAHHYLLADYGLDIKHCFPAMLFCRSQGDNDGMMHPRWINARLRNHDLMRSPLMRRVIRRQSESLYTLACQQMQDHSRLPVGILYETLNAACNKYSPSSVLFKVFYSLVHGGTDSFLADLQSRFDRISARLLFLKDYKVEKQAEEPPKKNIEEVIYEHNIGLTVFLRVYLRGIRMRLASLYRKMKAFR